MTQATPPATDTVRIALDERSYDIAIGADMLASLAQRADVPAGTAALVVSNTVVQPLMLILKITLQNKNSSAVPSA